MSNIKDIMDSLPVQFIIGGTTVSGISYLSNFVNPLIGGIFAGIPIGLPSVVFIDDEKVNSYLKNLTFMTYILSLATTIGYLIHSHTKLNKYNIAGLAMIVWFIIGFIYYIIMK